MNWLAEKITKAVGTMWSALAFTALALISLPAAIESHNALVIVSWIAQTFLQLVLLPIIMVGQSLQNKKHEKANLHHESHSKKLDEILKHLNDD